MESRIRAEERRKSDQRIVRLLEGTKDVVSDFTVGYGIYPRRAIYCSGALWALAWIVHRRALRIGAMAPTDKVAYDEFCKGRLPPHYQPFSPAIYSIENCLPLIKFGQDERWQPDPHFKRILPRPKSKWLVVRGLRYIVQAFALTPAKLRWFRWLMIALGWLLATFFVAGLTGLIKTG
jgi:hypothetical protein